MRHLDFHPSRRWVYVSLERQDRLEVYEKQKDGTLGKTPLYTKDTLSDPGNVRKPGQALGTIHMQSDRQVRSDLANLRQRHRLIFRASRSSTEERTASRSSPSTRKPASRR